ncbi:MAG: ClbS/DfsB family four-helix bundle protein [Methanomassiliicoccaceae archaeon]|nr:ClbS/DfsB family four-helix bundle protein [Methanomassiliicoccaceae archaeon]
MPRPTTKAELIGAATEQFDKLWKIIDSMPDDVQNKAFDFGDAADKKEAHWTRDKNLRDVLIHLYEWHRMVQRWYEEGTMKGGMPAVPGEGYTWVTLPDLNMEIWKRYQDVPLESAKEMLRKSHGEIMKTIESHTDEELFSKGIYKWTKTTTLGAYFISSTSSHYDWAVKKIKLHAKTCGK